MIKTKRIGLIGGMSWESTASYYRIINQEVRHRLGKLHSAELLLFSVDFQHIEALQNAEQWDEMGEVLAEAGRLLQRGGAEFIVLCTNTMHRVAEHIERSVHIPLLHIADATAAAIKAMGLTSVGLLGTRYTMERPFYRGRLENRHDLRVITPTEADRIAVHNVIYDELCKGNVREPSRELYRQTADKLVAAGAEGIILGCTEIGLLIGPDDASVPVFDTAVIHAKAAVDLALPPKLPPKASVTGSGVG